MASPTVPRVDATGADAASFRAKAEWHAQEAGRPVKEKIGIVLRLQREILPILRARRPLEAWERPWEIEP